MLSLLFELGVRDSHVPCKYESFPRPDLTIPYLAMPDTNWPSFLLEMPLNLGHAVRDSQGMIIISPNVSVEEKLTGERIKYILEGVPTNSKVHLVVSSSEVSTNEVPAEQIERLASLHHVHYYAIRRSDDQDGGLG